MKKITLYLLTACLCFGQRHVVRTGGTPIPAAARAAGYTLNTFSTNQDFNTSTVDKSLTYASGFQWYVWNFFSETPSGSEVTLNSDGSATVYQLNNNGNIASAGYIPGSPNYVGTAFGGGGYFEAVLSFPPNSGYGVHGWPAWWMMSLEHLSGLAGQQWAGQATGYDHFLEVDTFEYDRNALVFPNTFGSTLHDWYGIYNVTCTAYCDVQTNYNYSTYTAPIGTDWTLPHRYGCLWIPATGSTNGTFTFYLDDIPGPSFSLSSVQKLITSTATTRLSTIGSSSTFPIHLKSGFIAFCSSC